MKNVFMKIFLAGIIVTNCNISDQKIKSDSSRELREHAEKGDGELMETQEALDEGIEDSSIKSLKGVKIFRYRMCNEDIENCFGYGYKDDYEVPDLPGGIEDILIEDQNNIIVLENLNNKVVRIELNNGKVLKKNILGDDLEGTMCCMRFLGDSAIIVISSWYSKIIFLDRRNLNIVKEIKLPVYSNTYRYKVKDNNLYLVCSMVSYKEPNIYHAFRIESGYNITQDTMHISETQGSWYIEVSKETIKGKEICYMYKNEKKFEVPCVLYEAAELRKSWTPYEMLEDKILVFFIPEVKNKEYQLFVCYY